MNWNVEGKGTQGVTKFNVVEAKIVRSIHLHLNRCHLLLTNPTNLILIGFDKSIFKVQTF
jgi:hypothetical protein